jgi:RNA polymerase sigma factor (sigma-70 family)
VPETESQPDDPERRFRALYTAYYPAMLAYAIRRTDVSHDAADVVADIFTIAWRRLDQVPAAPADRLWLYGVAQRVVAGRRRSARRVRNLTSRLRAEQAVAAPQQAGGRDPARDHLIGALDRLSPAEREALQLVLWEQLSHAEAAQVLGCSVNAVTIRVHRAKARLRDLLAARTDHATALGGPPSTLPLPRP